ncbi:MAG TPA: hypothetical protein VGL17_07875, partial [Gemmatimonadaceae bacterium]
MSTSLPPRAGLFLGVVWRTIAFYAICIVVLIVLQTLASAAGVRGRVDAGNILYQWTTLASVVVATWVMLRRIDKLSWHQVGLDRDAASPPVVLKGAVLGAVTIGLASGFLLAIHMLRI